MVKRSWIQEKKKEEICFKIMTAKNYLKRLVGLQDLHKQLCWWKMGVKVKKKKKHFFFFFSHQ